MRRSVRIGLPIALLVMFLSGGWILRNKLEADRQGDWVRATREDLVTGFEVVGTLASISSDTLGPPQVERIWNFKISRLAREGSEVRKGQPVLSFDTTELQRQLQQKIAEADESRKQIEKERNDLALQSKDERLALAEAEAKLKKTSLKLEAPADLLGVAERKTTEIDYAIAKREAAAVRARLGALERAARARITLLESKRTEAEAFVARTQDAIRQMDVVATRDGTIIYISGDDGEKHKEGDDIWKGERVIEIPDLNQMKADGEVDEVDAGRVAVGQRVSLRLDAHPDEEFQGTIIRAGQTVQTKRGTRDPLKILRVEIKLDRTDPAKMRPGMRFQGTIELGRVKNAVLIPRDAVFLGADGPYVRCRGRIDADYPVPVKLGRENDRFVEVLQGLRAGDRVLVTRQNDEEKGS